MVKLIASDLDGTLLPEGTQDINPAIYDTIRKLDSKGIIFVAASGRELDTMKTVLAPVGDMIYFIANNGGRITKHMTEDIEMHSLDWNLVKNIITDVRKNENVLFVSVNTSEGTFTDSKNEEVLDWLINGYGLNAVIVDDIFAKELKVMKISVLTKGDAGSVVDPYKEKYGKSCNVEVAGEKWIDFTHSMASKGIAFKNLIDSLGIRAEETWAFGDNGNDISMLEAAGIGFAAPEARENVKESADICLKGKVWDSVINQINTLL